MEFDCEMFDDSEAALDALLARAAWDTPDEQMAERLKGLILAEELTPSPPYSGERGNGAVGIGDD